MKLKRILFWLILATFAGSIIWWIFYFPYNRERLYRAIPGNAIFVSEHGRVAERWPVIARNPFTLCLLTTAGFKQEGLTNAVMDKGLLATLDKFAAKNTVLAYVSSLNGSGEPAWIFSSWVGGQGQVFKWYTDKMLATANLKKVRLEGGRQIWQIRKKQNPKDPDFSFAIVEGVLLVCISRDPFAVRHLVNRVEHGAPIQADLRDQLNDASPARERVLDHGVVRWQQKRGDDFQLRTFKYELTDVGETSLTGWIKGDLDLLVSSNGNGETNNPAEVISYNLNDSPGLGALTEVMGRSPEIFALLPYNFVEPIMSGRRASRGVRIISNAVKTHADKNTAMFISVFGGDLSGRILGLKVPAVIAGVHVKDDTNSISQVAEIVDTLNALYKLSVIPRRDEAGGRPLVVMDSTRQGIYGSIAATDKPAVTTREGWLAISSSLGTLTNVVCLPASSKDAASLPRWARGIKDMKDCAAYMWIDLESATEAVKNAIAVYSLVLIAQNSEGTKETRAMMAQAKMWINVLKPVKTAEFRLMTSGPQFELRFNMGQSDR